MSLATVRALLRARLLDVPDLPPVRWEADGTKPTTTYIADDLRGGTASVSSTNSLDTRPLYLVTVHTAPEDRVRLLDAIADDIANAFEPGRTLIDADRTTQLEITSFDAGASRTVDGGWGYRRMTIGVAAWSLRTAFTPA